MPRPKKPRPVYIPPRYIISMNSLKERGAQRLEISSNNIISFRYRGRHFKRTCMNFNEAVTAGFVLMAGRDAELEAMSTTEKILSESGLTFKVRAEYDALIQTNAGWKQVVALSEKSFITELKITMQAYCIHLITNT
jgi:hypothetical protein